MQCILVEHANGLSKGRLIHRAFGGNGLFVSEGDFHRRQRKVMAPVFQPSHIATYAETMVRYGERLQQEWYDGAVVDLNQHMIALTMSIIGKVLFDTDVFTKTDELGAAMAIVNEDVSTRRLPSFRFHQSYRPPVICVFAKRHRSYGATLGT